MSAQTKQTLKVVTVPFDSKNETLLNHFHNRIIFKIYGLYAAIIIYKCNMAFVQRLRTNVMAVYYPKREKKRILHLYNESLKKRKRIRKQIQKMLSRKLKSVDANEENPLRVMRVLYSDYILF